jgi:4-amino-4-deoxy-L-arabinose transferase-like glycosyltransferase
MSLFPKPGIQRFRKYRTVLVILLFLPVIFINIRSNHDWGDDFAQYIHQAENIIKGIPQSQTGYVYNQENYIGPTAYPSGFPILLAPVYAIFGNSMQAFIFYISLFYLALAFAVIWFYKKHFSPLAAIVLAFILVYNPQLLLFKQEVMSDLPFTLFLVLAFCFYPEVKPGKTRTIVFFGILTGFIIMIRSVGFVLVMAIAVDQFIAILRKRKQDKLNHVPSASMIKSMGFPLLLTGIPVIFYFLINSLVFRIPSSGSLLDYLYFYYSGNFLLTIPDNLEQYVEVFRYMYTPVTGGFRFLSLLLGSAFLTMALLGFIRKISTRIEVFDYFFIFYVFILLVFPNNFSAYRLLIPVGFLLLFYAAQGFKSIRLAFFMSGKNRVFILGLLMLAMFIPGIINVTAGKNTMMEGPQQEDAVAAFRFISGNIADTSVIVFFKPRALALYTGKQGLADPFTEDPSEIHTQLVKASADYILIHEKLTRESMKRYSRVMKSRAQLIWKNKGYRLLKINPPNPAEQY